MEPVLKYAIVGFVFAPIFAAVFFTVVAGILLTAVKFGVVPVGEEAWKTSAFMMGMFAWVPIIAIWLAIEQARLP